MRRILMIALLGLAPLTTAAQSFYFSPDVPTSLAGNILASDVGRYGAGLYATMLSLPADTEIDALHRMNNGDWLFSVATPADLASFFESRDVIRYNGIAYATYFDGQAEGVPDGVSVDAVFLNGGDTGDLVLSFDVPAELGGNTYLPADLVEFTAAGFAPFFDSALAGVDLASNVTGADERGGTTLLSFDVPSDLGATYLPGDVVAWDGIAFSLYHRDAAWPISSRNDALSMLADPGEAPTLLVGKKSPTEVTLSWAASCAAGGVEDYAIHQGDIGAWYNHTVVDCSDDGGDLTEDLADGPGDHYFIVVAHNENDDGSYGRSSSGGERPMGIATCGPLTQALGCP